MQSVTIIIIHCTDNGVIAAEMLASGLASRIPKKTAQRNQAHLHVFRLATSSAPLKLHTQVSRRAGCGWWMGGGAGRQKQKRGNTTQGLLYNEQLPGKAGRRLKKKSL